MILIIGDSVLSPFYYAIVWYCRNPRCVGWLRQILHSGFKYKCDVENILVTAFSSQKRSFPLLSRSFWMLLMAVLVLSQGAAAVLPPPPSWGQQWWKCPMITKLPEDHQDNS